MPLTDREKQVIHEVRNWEKKLLAYQSNDFQLAYEKYIEQSFLRLPETIQKQFFSVLGNGLFHLHSILQDSQLQLDAKERLLSAGRAFKSEIETIADLKTLEIDQLQYLAEQQIARHRFYSFTQGGLAGSGNSLFLGIDLPAIAVINLRVVQLIAMTYGFEVNTPYEMMTSLKVFHIATLPPRIKKSGWNMLIEEFKKHKERYFYEGSEKIIDITWLEQPLEQLLKALVIILLRKKVVSGIPIISMAVGAGANYQLTRKVTEFAHNYYLLRYLLEKEGIHDEY